MNPARSVANFAADACSKTFPPPRRITLPEATGPESGGKNLSTQAEVDMINRDDLPPTPEWIPESRDGEVRPAAKMSFGEALALWDRDWAHWSGDDG